VRSLRRLHRLDRNDNRAQADRERLTRQEPVGAPSPIPPGGPALGDRPGMGPPVSETTLHSGPRPAISVGLRP
jgi:hypothetical protein